MSCYLLTTPANISLMTSLILPLMTCYQVTRLALIEAYFGYAARAHFIVVFVGDEACLAIGERACQHSAAALRNTAVPQASSMAAPHQLLSAASLSTEYLRQRILLSVGHRGRLRSSFPATSPSAPKTRQPDCCHLTRGNAFSTPRRSGPACELRVNAPRPFQGIHECTGHSTPKLMKLLDVASFSRVVA